MLHCHAQSIVNFKIAYCHSGTIILNSCPCNLMKAESLMQFKRLVTQKRFLGYGIRGKQLFLFNYMYALLLVVYLVVLADKFLSMSKSRLLLSTTTVPTCTCTCLRHVRSLLSIKKLYPSACNVKPRPNDRNIPMQHVATLLGTTCCVRLTTVLRHVGCCWLKFD